MSNIYKSLIIIIAPAVLLNFFTKVCLGAGQFSSNYEVNYTFLDNGQANVAEKITITNQTLDFYLSRFELALGVTDIAGLVVTDESNTAIKTSLMVEDKSSRIEMFINEKSVGLGKEKIVNLSYTTHSLASQSGLMWAVAIPKLENTADVQTYNVAVKVPKSFGSPEDVPDKSDAAFYYYFLNKEQLITKAYQYSFGDYQLYDFEIIYALKNPNLFAANLEITLPPYIDGVQEVYFDSLIPKPLELIEEADGNQLARFRVSGGKTIRPKVKGVIRVFSGTNDRENLRPLPTQQDLSPQPFWESDDPEIRNLATELKVPQKIYNYIVSSIDYSDDTAIALDGRIGALSALSQKRGVCTEYSDLFVALARSAGTPAQALEGFAYTPENAHSKNTSILHAWARYWDTKKGWQYIDPTWGHTTSGIDYFQKFDTNHIVFAIKGLSSTTPYPAGSYLKGETEFKDELTVTPSKNDKCFNKKAGCGDFLTFETLKKEIENTQGKKINFSRTVFLSLVLFGISLILTFAAILLRR